ncbi:hypothetical protein [Lichenibacterium dinghuense]|uniref:hypothetical protein n=1 Tax=Lichenibacterium dinghuense TaxID=2895977 RepID=UPI001F199A5A|nr:hypothetical protein [Lichenibacterium sp. 6Y81]
MVDFNGVRGCEVILRPEPAISGSVSVEPARPTLGEILDMLTAECPERIWTCDPALRDVRVGSVMIQDR